MSKLANEELANAEMPRNLFPDFQASDAQQTNLDNPQAGTKMARREEGGVKQKRPSPAATACSNGFRSGSGMQQVFFLQTKLHTRIGSTTQKEEERKTAPPARGREKASKHHKEGRWRNQHHERGEGSAKQHHPKVERRRKQHHPEGGGPTTTSL